MSNKRKTTSISKINTEFPTISKFESSINEFSRTYPTETSATFIRPVIPGYLSELLCTSNPYTTIKYKKTEELKTLEKKRKDFNRDKIRNYPVTENVTRDIRIKFNVKNELKNFKYFLDRNEAVEARESVIKKKPIHDLKYYPNYDFVVEKRKICLLNLAGKLTLENIDKLDRIIENEEESIRKETEVLQKDKQENEENLKVICQRTYKAVRIADSQALKKNKALEKLKRANFILAKLNSRCIQLEEEYITLKGFKKFLKKAFQNRDKIDIGSKISFIGELPLTSQIKDYGKELTENDSSDNPETKTIEEKVEIIPKKPEKENNVNLFNINNHYTSFDKDELHELKVEIISNFINNNNKFEISAKKKSLSNLAFPSESRTDYPSSSDDSFASEIYKPFYEPSELVNIFTNLEINNLSLIENVQEQEEMCDYLKKQIECFKKDMEKQILDIDGKINDESEKVEEIKASIEWIEENNNSLRKFNSITRYKAFFCLKESELTTLDDLLDFLTEQIRNLYCLVFATNDSEKINPVKMLKCIESLVDSQYIELQKYDKKVIIKTKKIIDERKRHANRIIQNKLNKETRVKKLQLAMEAFLLPPKYKNGRKIVFRSDPLKQISKRSQLNLEEIRQQEENEYFFT